MNNEKEIKRMAEQIEQSLLLANRYAGSMNKGKGHWIASYLVNAGYGNVKQAVKEFAEKLKNITCVLSVGTEMDGSNLIIQVTELFKIIDNLITELYGADE